jgi:hypothetical protein
LKTLEAYQAAIVAPEMGEDRRPGARRGSTVCGFGFGLLAEGLGAGGTDCIFHATPGLLRLAFHFLGQPFDLGIGVAGPLAHLALGTAGNLIDGAFHSIRVHHFLPSEHQLSASVHSFSPFGNQWVNPLPGEFKATGGPMRIIPLNELKMKYLFARVNGAGRDLRRVILTCFGKDCPASWRRRAPLDAERLS